MSKTSYIETEHVPVTLRPMIEALCRVGSKLSLRIARGPLEERLGANLGSNSDGDTQKALDVIADQAFADALRGTGVRHYASEERETIEVLDPDGEFALAIDPLDGSSNIDVNVSIGTIFSIYPAGDTAENSFLRPSDEQIAAGYLIYGPQTTLMITFGQGVLQFVRDPLDGEFKLVVETLTIPEGAREFAINASNYRHWSKPIRAYIDDCLAGVEGPRDKNFNMRWVASLVAETHRILTRGGIFLYPSDDRPGYEQGRLRMVYECAPIAMLVEQAGGQATSGCDRLLGQQAETLHARTPLIFGSADKVSRVCAYHDLPEHEVSALFGNRGLFRA
ncbi:Fructose-1,6-bisphosphatase class 1 [Thalassovita gelatinovora]|uniref:Fructose-1,6-bisphosphatase class 1 n=1 Tax=Thalassovita gelatinovora TaxID=53501 RepID=A0A0P1FT75_THAGE|nr:class 1 fructose-bisphosphatase [Thalassovita gelatinovora]QIZ80391.1 class 1 fructose-bisphosphatase [Thalassovita gelatinovora]CUH64367.1 Fructose-1,6-bisphosphatase class 1 [Thalassovita gelatinovora]SEQ92669.1 D-fructose 1,6-bisphosphatase [Thalassovita gelatinovora]